MNFLTIPQLLLELEQKYGDTKKVFTYKKGNEYVSINHHDLRERVENFAFGMLNLGFRAGDRIGLVSENRIEWIIADLAIASISAISVPLFSTLTPKQEEQIFNDCEASAVIVSNNYQLIKILEIKEQVPSLRHIIVLNNDFKERDFAVKSMEYIANRGNELKTSEIRKDMFTELCLKVKPEDLLTIIYTSGTTGTPKGVMLSHHNVVSDIKSCVDGVDFRESDTLLTYLPWCHAYERTCGYYAFFTVGATIVMAESIESVAANMIEFKPTIMTTVPRLLEIIMKKIYNSIERESAVKQKLFHWAVKIGKEYIKAKHEGKNPLGVQYSVADKLVFSKLREKTGGRIKKFVSGGAPLSQEISEFFNAIGLVVFEGYGLTEASPVVAATDPKYFEIGTVGRPLPRIEVKFAEDGEILVRGENVMQGYWNDTVATQQAIDEDGWLYTGDIGYLTQKGNIKITDRKKYIFVTSGGKNIAPQPIESLIAQSPYIEHCILIGESREYCTALILPDFIQLRKLANNFGINFTSDSELISNDKIVKTIKDDIDRLQKDLAKFERVRKFSLLTQSFSIENGELTPKLSIRRHIVERKYSDLIEDMYGLG